MTIIEELYLMGKYISKVMTLHAKVYAP